MAIVEPNIRPATLYRYRSLKQFEQEISSITSATLFCAAYHTLNDPMEGLFAPSKKMRESEDYRATKKLIANAKANLGVCSFSESNTNELMWSHYADQYRGICIAYTFQQLLSNLADDVSFARIQYSDRAPTVPKTLGHEQMAKRILSYKNYRWVYEREWRMFGPRGAVNYTLHKCVRRVYLGSQISKINQDVISRRLTKMRIDVKVMSLDNYLMSFENLTDSEV